MTIIAKGSRRKESWSAAGLSTLFAVMLGYAFTRPAGPTAFFAEASLSHKILLLSAPLMIALGIAALIKIRRDPAPDLVIQDGHLQQPGTFGPLAVDEITGVAFKPGNVFRNTPARLVLDLRDGSACELSTTRLAKDGDQIARAIAAALGFEPPLPSHLRSRADEGRNR